MHCESCDYTARLPAESPRGESNCELRRVSPALQDQHPIDVYLQRRV
jgi:hypothetical protein